MQVPLQEASKFRERHPFDQPQPVKLAVQPPSDRLLSTPVIVPHLSSSRVVEDRSAYHKAILRKNGFALDYEAASAFTSEVHVTYSWGLPSYTYTQFVHQSGLVLAQITDDENGDFLLLPNRLATNRMTGATWQNEMETVEGVTKRFRAFCGDEEALRQLYAQAETNNRPRGLTPSPFSSPALGADLDVPPISLPPHLSLRIGHRQAMKDALERL